MLHILKKRLLIGFLLAAAVVVIQITTPSFGLVAEAAHVPASAVTCARYYRVRPGDTLSAIARRFGVSQRQLARANRIRNPNLIYIGQSLCIPGKKPAPKPSPTPSKPIPSPTPIAKPTTIPAPIVGPWTPPAQTLEVFSPVVDAAYHSPIDVIGYAKTPESIVNIRLRDSSGAIIAERLGSSGGIEHPFFSAYLRFETQTSQTATLEILEISPGDGSEISKAQLPLTILPGQRVVDLDLPGIGANLCTPIVMAGYSNTAEGNVAIELAQRDGRPIVQESLAAALAESIAIMTPASPPPPKPPMPCW